MRVEEHDFEDLTPPRETGQFPFETRYQQHILSMLLNDRVFLTQSLNLIRPNYFVNLDHEIICSALTHYFQNNKQVPVKFVMHELLREKIKDKAKLLKCVGEYELCASLWVPGQDDREHCLEKLIAFSKEQSLREAISKTAELLKKNTADKWSTIEELFRQAILVDRSFDMGLDYFNELEERYARFREELNSSEVFISGFEGIDSRLSSGGLKRGEIGAFLGLSGTGKSLLLCHAAVRNIMRGKKVLYVSLEMDQDKIAKRFDSQFARVEIGKLLHEQERVISSVRSLVSDEPDKRLLVIKQFPAGTCTVNMIRGLINQLRLQNFNPDLLVLDYIGEMFDGGNINVKTYEVQQRNVRDLRALSVEENICIYTATQANRKGREDVENGSGFLSDDSLASSFGIARPLDLLVSINTSVTEKSCGLCRLYIVKNRDGRSMEMIYLQSSDDALDFQEITQAAHASLLSRAVEKSATDVRLERVMNKNKRKSFNNGE